MLQFSRIVLALALLTGASAFAPATRLMRASALNANVVDTLAALEGPPIPWGSAGVPLGHDEADIKGQASYSKVVAAIKAAGIDLSSGDFTIFAPTDDAVEEYGKELTADVLKYHVAAGKISKDSIGGDVPTLNGKSLTYKRFARQTFLDDAVVGQVPQGAATGQVFPVDVAADNGVIHAIDMVLDPSWSKVDVESGLGGIAN